MEKIIKTEYEYCHIDNDKIVFTKAFKTVDLVTDYAKSTNDLFKTLMVFFFHFNIYNTNSCFLL
jgi:hypothetical protein